eukprot:scaffold11731_cov308-Chaetoceros_neogracile.AAC.1
MKSTEASNAFKDDVRPTDISIRERRRIAVNDIMMLGTENNDRHTSDLHTDSSAVSIPAMPPTQILSPNHAIIANDRMTCSLDDDKKADVQGRDEECGPAAIESGLHHCAVSNAAGLEGSEITSTEANNDLKDDVRPTDISIRERRRIAVNGMDISGTENNDRHTSDIHTHSGAVSVLAMPPTQTLTPHQAITANDRMPCSLDNDKKADVQGRDEECGPAAIESGLHHCAVSNAAGLEGSEMTSTEANNDLKNDVRPTDISIRERRRIAVDGMNISERNILPISAAVPKLQSICVERGSLVFGTEVALITSSIRSATSARKRERSSLDSENKRAKISKASDQNRMGSM